eukprot:2635970-Amphidinium_carterae.1
MSNNTVKKGFVAHVSGKNGQFLNDNLGWGLPLMPRLWNDSLGWVATDAKIVERQLRMGCY